MFRILPGIVKRFTHFADVLESEFSEHQLRWIRVVRPNPDPKVFVPEVVLMGLRLSDIHVRTYYTRKLAATGRFLFQLAETMLPWLAQAAPVPQLISAFSANSYDLAATATISSAPFWQITNSREENSLTTYQFFKIVKQADGLHVYGATTLWLGGFSSPVAFGAAAGIQPALNAASICPNGFPRKAYDDGLFTWEQMMTATRSAGNAS